MNTPGNIHTRRFSRDDVARLVEVGIIGADERLEHFDGELLVVPQPDPRHAPTLAQLSRRLREVYGDGYSVRTGLPLDCGKWDTPKPDIAVVRGDESTFLTRLPRGDETVLVIELVCTSYMIDRRKTGLYAEHRVPVYWFACLGDGDVQRVSVYEAPGLGYQEQRHCEDADELALPQSDVRCSVRSLFGP